MNKTGTLIAKVKSYDWSKLICLKWIFTPPWKQERSVLEMIEPGKMCSMLNSTIFLPFSSVFSVAKPARLFTPAMLIFPS